MHVAADKKTRSPARAEEKLKMTSYTIEMASGGQVSEGFFADDTAAVAWVESVLEADGHDADDLVSGDWGSDGQNDDGQSCERMLFWADEASAINDSGAKAICQLCVVR